MKNLLSPRRGSALVLTLLFLAVLSVMAMAFATVTSNTIEATHDARRMHRAQAAAESGLEYIKMLLSNQSKVLMPTDSNLPLIKDQLRTQPIAQGKTEDIFQLRNDSGAIVRIDGANPIEVAKNWFLCQFEVKNKHLLVRVTGYSDNPNDPTKAPIVTRTVSAEFNARVKYPHFDMGAFSMGSATLGGSANILSKKDANGVTLYPLLDNDGNVVLGADGKPKDGASLRSASELTPAITQNGNRVPSGGFWTPLGQHQIPSYTGTNYTQYTAPTVPTFSPTDFRDLATRPCLKKEF